MKRLFLILFAAIITSQMWGASTYYAYGYFATSAERSMGKIGIGIGAYPAESALQGGSTCSGVSKSQSGFWTAYYYAVPNKGYKFLGWTTSSSSTAYLLSGAAQYTKSASTNSSCTLYAHFAVDDSGSGSGSGSGGSTTPTAGALAEKTITRTSTASECIGTGVSIPSDAVEMGYDYMWCSHNYGESSATNYNSSNRKTWSEITAMTFDAGWRMPVYDVETGYGGFKNVTYNSSERKAYSTKEGFTDKYIQFTTSYNFVWLGTTATATSSTARYYLNTSNGTSTYKDWSTCNLQFRLVYEPNKVGIYKLTVLVKTVEGGNTTTKACVYYCASGQQIKITPTAANGYTMKWNSESTTAAAKTFTVTSNTTATLTYTQAVSYVTATFKNYDNSTLYTNTQVQSGTTPTYGGSTPTKPQDNTYTYTFTGWDPTLAAITSDQTYTAQFSSVYRNYTVRFLNSDNSTAYSSKTDAHYGDAISAPQGNPTKGDANGKYFEFDHWQVAGTSTAYTSSMTVSGNIDFEPVYTEKSYLIATFNNHDKSQLHQQLVKSGVDFTYGGSTPTKATDETNSYAFAGWDKTLNITSNTTFTAQFTPTPVLYSVIFRICDNSECDTLSNASYQYNQVITNKPSSVIVAPVAQDSDEYYYEFDNWYTILGDDTVAYEDDMKVTRNMIFEPEFKLQGYKFDTVRVEVVGGGLGQVVVKYYGKTYTMNAADSTYRIFRVREESGSLSAVATAARGYHIVVDGTYAASQKLRSLKKNETLTFKFEANTPLDLIENHAAGYNTTLVSNHENEYLTVTVKNDAENNRVIANGDWATICLPFDYDVTSADIIYDQIYTLSDAKLVGNIATLNFVRQTHLTAYTPYLITARQQMNELVFDGVQLKAAPTTPEELQVTQGNVDFIGTVDVTTVKNADLNNPTYFYISGKGLKFAGKKYGVTMYGYRAYFNKNTNPIAGAPRRAIVRLGDEETIEAIITQDGELVPVTRKYIENGTMIIERDGVRYTADGVMVE